jgi:hypothetical protein
MLAITIGSSGVPSGARGGSGGGIESAAGVSRRSLLVTRPEPGGGSV